MADYDIDLQYHPGKVNVVPDALNRLPPGDHVFLKISPNRDTICFGRHEKLNPRYVRPFDVLEKIGEVAYRLGLPPALAEVHDLFHVSQLQRYVRDPSHVIDFSDIEVRPDLTYEKQPVAILDRREKTLRNQTIMLVRVMWHPDSPSESTWETESEMRQRYPHMFLES
ncbi:uncharacterized protein LOC109847588 [Asparagus officinalis]|uniref:uncharacterized protein LOC109847588 n=1 Tax=Asparagus officinalis TaxID=4686 RepID=UPI00098E205C|nr:uncharacterized protein LOC109847588 [Asparagus officinalis]